MVEMIPDKLQVQVDLELEEMSDTEVQSFSCFARLKHSRVGVYSQRSSRDVLH